MVGLFLVHQSKDLAFKSPKIMVNKELQEVLSLKTFSEFESSETYMQHQHNPSYFV